MLRIHTQTEGAKEDACLNYILSKLSFLPAPRGDLNVLVTEQSMVAQRHKQDVEYLVTRGRGKEGASPGELDDIEEHARQVEAELNRKHLPLNCPPYSAFADTYLKVLPRDQGDQSRSVEETRGTTQDLKEGERVLVVAGQADEEEEAGSEGEADGREENEAKSEEQADWNEEEEAGSEAEAVRKEVEEAELERREGQARAWASPGLQDTGVKGKRGPGGVAMKGRASRKEKEETGPGRKQDKNGKGKARD